MGISQTEVALITTDSKYIGLSQSLRHAIPRNHLSKQFKVKELLHFINRSYIHFRLLEDNRGAMEIARFTQALKTSI
jgi:hypothetical protein